MDELLNKISAEKRWAVTVRILTGLYVMRGDIFMIPLLNEDEGVFAPVEASERWTEILMKLFSDSAKKLFTWVKETFSIPVEDAIGAANLENVACKLLQGPEFQFEIVEATRERTVVRCTHCAWWEKYKEFELERALIPCDAVDQAWTDAGLTAINPKLTYKVTKAKPRGDPYCEGVIEFKEK